MANGVWKDYYMIVTRNVVSHIDRPVFWKTRESLRAAFFTEGKRLDFDVEASLLVCPRIWRKVQPLSISLLTKKKIELNQWAMDSYRQEGVASQ